MSVSLCLLSNVTKNENFKKELAEVSMSLIKISEDDHWQLREKLSEIIDLLDLAKILNWVTIMNAEIIIEAALKIIEELDSLIRHSESFLIPKLELTQLRSNLQRDKVRDSVQTKYHKTNPNLQTSPASKIETPKIGKSEIKDVTEGNEVSDPIVYTFFGSEDKIINDRREKILSILKSGGGASIGDISKQFPGLNSKTLQRDLLDLMREKRVIMLGKKRWAKYYLK